MKSYDYELLLLLTDVHFRPKADDFCLFYVALLLSMTLGSIKNICDVWWKGWAKTAPLGLQEGNKAPYYGVVNINCIEFENVHIRFEYCRQRLNSIQFGRTLAENELTALHGMTRASQLSNMAAYLPTDCPTREKHGWLGDAQVT